MGTLYLAAVIVRSEVNAVGTGRLTSLAIVLLGARDKREI